MRLTSLAVLFHPYCLLVTKENSAIVIYHSLWKPILPIKFEPITPSLPKTKTKQNRLQWKPDIQRSLRHFLHTIIYLSISLSAGEAPRCPKSGCWENLGSLPPAVPAEKCCYSASIPHISKPGNFRPPFVFPASCHLSVFKGWTQRRRRNVKWNVLQFPPFFSCREYFINLILFPQPTLPWRELLPLTRQYPTRECECT